MNPCWLEVLQAPHHCALAASAGVGKPTIYRWWPSKGVLALDAVSDRMGESRDFPDTGDIAADLTWQANLVIEQFRGDTGTVFRGVIGAAQACLRQLLDYTATRELFGRPLAANPATVGRMKRSIAICSSARGSTGAGE